MSEHQPVNAEKDAHHPRDLAFDRVAHTPGVRLTFACACGRASNLTTVGKDVDEAVGRAEAICATHVVRPAADQGASAENVRLETAEKYLARALAAEDKIAAVEAVLVEYERSCDPAPYTSERALYERLRSVILPAADQRASDV